MGFIPSSEIFVYGAIPQPFHLVSLEGGKFLCFMFTIDWPSSLSYESGWKADPTFPFDQISACTQFVQLAVDVKKDRELLVLKKKI